MYEWIALNDFRLITSNADWKYKCESIDHTLYAARSFLPGWTDEQAEKALCTFLDDFEDYVRSLAKHTESERLELIEFLRADYSWKESLTVDTDSIFYFWQTDKEADENIVLDELGEEMLIEQILIHDYDSNTEWEKSDSSCELSGQQIYACLTLGAISCFDWLMRYPMSGRTVRESIPYNEATTEEQLFGVEQAFNAAIKASYFLQKAYESKLFDMEYSKLQKKQRKKITQTERARKGGIARAKRFAPLKSFVIGEYHKKKYESDLEAGRELAEKLTGFYVKNPKTHRLSITRSLSD